MSESLLAVQQEEPIKCSPGCTQMAVCAAMLLPGVQINDFLAWVAKSFTSQCNHSQHPDACKIP